MSFKTTLRKKSSFYFAICFAVLWSVSSFILFNRFEKNLWESFDNQMKIRASYIAERTNIDPRIVPLPQNDENYLIIYTTEYYVDTLYAPSQPVIKQINEQRHIKFEKSENEEDEDGLLSIIYSISDEEVTETINNVFIGIIIILILGIILSILLGYWISGKILSPVSQVINLANRTDIINNISLLSETKTEDELKELIVSFNRMLLRIKEQTDNQNAFFSSASHELRTPLSVMKTRLQVLLQDKSLNFETKEIYQQQLIEVERMIKMVNDFLLMSEFKNGNIQIRKEEVNLLELVTDIITHNINKIKERELNFKLSIIPEESEFLVNADSDKLNIILSNIINNSIKYSEQQTIIDIEMIKNKKDLRFSIKNKIRKDINPDISNVKEKFYYSKPLKGEGFGLGLWISNQLALLQDFDFYIYIENNDTFKIELIIPL